jgi:hypothetical protein
MPRTQRPTFKPLRRLDAMGSDLGVLACGHFLSRTIYGRNIKCPRPATHRLVFHGPAGERVEHDARCELHATDRVINSYRERPGWRAAWEATPE